MSCKETTKNPGLSIEDIINGMSDWVRVIDRSNTIIYINEAMAKGLNGCPVGEKCYKAIGRAEPCENCTSRKAVFDGCTHLKEEVIDGRTYSVMSSPVRSTSGEITAVVEVLRDITPMKQMQEKILQQNRKLQDDLALARKLQCSLLPKASFGEKIDFSYIYKPCQTLGGDFLDIFKIDENHTGIYIADVSGHGVPASMLTIFLRSSLNRKTLSPARALEELYHDFNRHSFGQNLYITVFYAIIDEEKQSMIYSNAGHNAGPIIYGSHRFDILRLPGIPISDWLENPGYTEKSTDLMKGDRVFFYTDGIIEMRNSANEQFGEERLLDVLLYSKLEPSGILNRMVESALEFAGIGEREEIPDDITIALLEMK